jgi:aryl-alcohol dehydrogenase-like predicted oxidoreductase
MDDLVRSGKIQYYGVSVEKVEEAIKAIEYPNVSSVQIIFNIFRQRPTELFFPLAQQKKVAILARVPLASGMLTGKMNLSTTFDQSDHRSYNRHGERFDRGETFSGVDYEKGLKTVEKLRALLPAGVSMPQFALRWITMFDAVSCAIPGAKYPSQVAENAAAADLPPLSPQIMADVKQIYEEDIRPIVHHYW